MIALPKEPKLAVLIDAENGISTNAIPLILNSLDSILDQSKTRLSGVIRRAYGNWFLESLQAWQSILAEAEIEPVCTPFAKFSTAPNDYKPIKNAADMRLVIDAMELLLLQKFNCFCIVSSDRDFTPLVRRLKELGATVIGYGRANASTTLKQAYHAFVPMETFLKTASKTCKTTQPTLQIVSGSGGGTVTDLGASAGRQAAIETAAPSPQPQLSAKQIDQLLRAAYQHCATSSNWITVKDFQQQLQALCSKQKVLFSCARFGCKGLEKLIEKLGNIEWDTSQTNIKHLIDRRFKLKQAA